MCLKLIIRSELLPNDNIDAIYEEADELCRIIGKSVYTARRSGK